MSEQNEAIDGGGPAWPQLHHLSIVTADGKTVDIPEGNMMGGMSVRDWLAGQALSGVLANAAEMFSDHVKEAARCYAYADAMIAERAKGKTNDDKRD